MLVDPVFGELGFGAVVSAFYYNEDDIPPICLNFSTCGRESAAKVEEFLRYLSFSLRYKISLWRIYLLKVITKPPYSVRGRAHFQNRKTSDCTLT